MVQPRFHLGLIKTWLDDLRENLYISVRLNLKPQKDHDRNTSMSFRPKYFTKFLKEEKERGFYHFYQILR